MKMRKKSSVDKEEYQHYTLAEQPAFNIQPRMIKRPPKSEASHNVGQMEFHLEVYQTQSGISRYIEKPAAPTHTTIIQVHPLPNQHD